MTSCHVISQAMLQLHYVLLHFVTLRYVTLYYGIAMLLTVVNKNELANATPEGKVYIQLLHVTNSMSLVM